MLSRPDNRVALALERHYTTRSSTCTLVSLIFIALLLIHPRGFAPWTLQDALSRAMLARTLERASGL
jgi:hypothetical protein